MHSLLVASVSVAILGAVAAQQPIEVQGTLEKQTKWSGVVRVVGDVTVPDGAQLEIAAGTRVIIAEQDASNGGWNPKLVEIHVKGQLVAEGNGVAPIVIAPDGDGEQKTVAWHGIVLYPSHDEDQRRDRLRAVRIDRAFSAVQVPAGSPLIEECVFRRCGTGVESGSAFKDDRQRGTRGGRSSPEVNGSRFVECRTGLYAESLATPSLERCVFFQCETGAGSRRPVFISHLPPPGCNVQHCAMIDCGIAIYGCALVRSSVFLRCKTVLQLSDYHDELATHIDQVLFADNLVHECDREIVGDTAAARDMLRGDPAFQGPLEELRSEWPPLPDCLQLGASSAAIGKAKNGADLGPKAGRGGGRMLREWVHGGAAIRGWTTAQTDVAKAWSKLTKVQPGTAQGKSWWAVADTTDDGVVHLLPVLLGERKEVVLALEFDAGEAGSRKFEVTADSELLEVSNNGKVAGKVEGRRRFGAQGEPIAVDVKQGRNLLILHIVTWSPEPRCAAALDGVWQVAAPAPAGEVPKVTLKTQPARGGAIVEATFAATLHWASAEGDFVRVRVKGLGEPQAVEARWTAAGKLRIGPLPADYSKQEVEVTFPGLRAVTGEAVAIEPQSVRIP